MLYPTPERFRVVALAKHGNVKKTSIQPSIASLAESVRDRSQQSLLNTVNTSRETGVSVVELDVRLSALYAKIDLSSPDITFSTPR